MVVQSSHTDITMTNATSFDYISVIFKPLPDLCR